MIGSICVVLTTGICMECLWNIYVCIQVVLTLRHEPGLSRTVAICVPCALLVPFRLMQRHKDDRLRVARPARPFKFSFGGENVKDRSGALKHAFIFSQNKVLRALQGFTRSIPPVGRG